MTINRRQELLAFYQDVDQNSIDSLRNQCYQLGLSTVGGRIELTKRLINYNLGADMLRDDKIINRESLKSDFVTREEFESLQKSVHDQARTIETILDTYYKVCSSNRDNLSSASKANRSSVTKSYEENGESVTKELLVSLLIIGGCFVLCLCLFLFLSVCLVEISCIMGPPLMKCLHEWLKRYAEWLLNVVFGSSFVIPRA